MSRLANSRYCFVCGVENGYGLKLILDSDEPGHVKGKIVIPGRFDGWPGIVHGGILSAILDESAGRSIESAPFPNETFLTGTLNVRFRKPALSETPLYVDAELVKRKGRVAVAASKIMDESGQVLAEAEATFVQIKEENAMNHTGKADEWIMVPGEES